eukprot:CAMPEP_0170063494 /NCGR_PEP_ID=MMETSP0019_2-20121128/4338_1 /TAXON_ID=98059 /ORGANISM="Dinobryon sp., Strain UTEXLB2267" /LENGTH=320 /DNA_ID=CAMNT_0010269933 /DNA_START=252 /DNA_END=1216 /DNA_ORIENTATION=-
MAIKSIDKEFLNSGSGIIDVAGGKGELSFELLILNDIKSTVFDPRPLELSKFVRKYLLGYYQKNEILKSYNTVVDNKSSSVKTLKIPPQIRGYFEVTDSETNPPVDFTFPTILTNQDIYLENISKSTHTGWGLKHSLQSLQLTSFSSIYSWVEGQNEGIICQLCNISNECLSLEGESDGSIPFEKALQTLQHCSIIVGMHPDQAAEHIVNWAIRNNKPFAIIPCCVFARRFPKRQLKDGKSVTSYGDLISYLMEKHSDIQAVEMDFEGRNVLLYFLAGVPVHYDVHNNNVAIAPDPLVAGDGPPLIDGMPFISSRWTYDL